MRWLAVAVCLSALWPCYVAVTHTWVALLGIASGAIADLERLKAASEPDDQQVRAAIQRTQFMIVLMREHWWSYVRWVALAIAWSIAGGALLARYW